MSGAPAPTPFLDALAPEDAQALLVLGSERRFGRGDVLFHQGDDSTAVVVLLEGRAKVTLIGRDGTELILAFPGPHDVLGELAGIDESPRAATVRAVEPVRAVHIPRPAFERFLATRPQVAALVLRTVAARLRSTDQQRLEFAAYDVTGRVARRLVELSERHGTETPRGIEIDLPISQEELAAWTAASREAVAKALQLLRALGWVETSRRRMLVLDLPALRAYVS